jgi:4-cresol dehydrogenase (hydroxylating)
MAQPLEQLKQVVGEANVLSSLSDIERHSLDITLWETRGVAVVLPESVAQVARVVRIAAEHRLPVWTFSGGKNWGYGAKLARENGAVILYLKRMNQIREVNEDLAYAVVEPGVTYRQLDNYLKSRSIKLWADCTDSTPEGSVLGNALERGIGYTHYSDHFGALCGMEVVLPSGEVLRTGGGPPNSNVHHIYKWGVGPYLDGLFGQSNLGVVTSAGIWLMPEPAAMAAYVCEIDRDEDFLRAVDALRYLALRGIIAPNMHIANDIMSFANLVQYPYDRLDGATYLSPQVRAELRRRLLVSRWLIGGAVYGEVGQVRLYRRIIRRELGSFGRITFFDDRKMRLVERLAGPWKARQGGPIDRALRSITHASYQKVDAVRHLYPTFKGIPGEHILSFAYFKNRRYKTREDRPTKDVDPARDGCGLIWANVSCPMTSENCGELVRILEPVFQKHGFDMCLVFLTQNPRTLMALMPLFFDRDNPDERARVTALYDEIFDVTARTGYQQARTTVAHFDRILSQAPEYCRFVQTLKHAVDPENVLAPGRYGIGEPVA